MRNAELTPAEQALAAAVPRGQEVDLSTAGSGRSVRAEVLAGLLLGEYADPADKPALRLTGARITGLLHLAFGEIDFPVTFRRCAFDEAPDLYQARTRFLSFDGSELPGLVASNLQVEGNLRLTGCHVTGELRLPGARINGTLTMNGARLDHPGGAAVNAERLDVGGDLRAHDGFACDGELILTAARVGAALNLDGARLRAPAGWRSAARTWSSRWACSPGTWRWTARSTCVSPGSAGRSRCAARACATPAAWPCTAAG
ncbi:hypothetical protein ACFQYP_26440 [Nonomuraea antimicrobica]